MSLRSKALLIVGALLVGLIAFSYAVSQAIVLASAAIGDEQSSRRNVERVLETLPDMLSDLNNKADNLAQWDETYKFIEDSNPAFIEANVSDRAFTERGLRVIVFVHTSGGIVFGKALDPNTQQARPLYASLQEQLADPRARDLLLNYSDPNKSTTGLLLLPEGPLLVAARPIVTTEAKGPIRGALILGRFLDTKQVEHLSKLTSSAVTLRRLDDPGMPRNFQAARSSLTPQTPIFVQSENEQTMAGYAFISDLFGKPVLILRTESPRFAYRQAQTSLRDLLFALVLLGVIGSLAILLGLEKLVLAPLARLNAAVGQIGASGTRSVSSRVEAAGKDELAKLAHSMNGMLDTIERSHQELRGSEKAEHQLALENARLLAESGRAVRELDTLNKIATRINSTLDLQRVLDLTMQELKDLLAVEVCSLMLLDEQTQELVFTVSLGPGAEETKLMRLSINQGIAGFVVREGQPAMSNDVRNDPRWYSRVDSSTGFVTRSILAVPLRGKEKVIGVIEVINKLEREFDSTDLALLNSIAMPVATAIENARLFGEMVQSRAQILESRNTLRALFDGISADVFIADRDLRIKAINLAAANASGEEPQSLIGKMCQDVVCNASDHCEICPIKDTFRTGKTTLRDDHRIGRDGKARELEVGTWPLENAQGEIDRVIYIAQDVTEKRRMEATLVQSARLSAVGELAASVTHEIGNPLTAIIGNAQMLLRVLDRNDPCYEMAQVIERAGLRVDKVVRNLLNLSRQEQYQFAPVEVNASIEDAISLVSYQIEREKIQIIKQFDNNLPLVRGSANYLETVWTNLLINAKDATVGIASVANDKKGQIQITTRLTEDKQAVQITFADNGNGIAESELSRIFDPFFTTKPRGKGTGLGLYISSVVIAHHHGTLQAFSRLGQGSTFVVTLPRENGATSAQ